MFSISERAFMPPELTEQRLPMGRSDRKSPEENTEPDLGTPRQGLPPGGLRGSLMAPPETRWGRKPHSSAVFILQLEKMETSPCLPKPTVGEEELQRDASGARPVGRAADGAQTERGGAGPGTQHLLPASPG